MFIGLGLGLNRTLGASDLIAAMFANGRAGLYPTGPVYSDRAGATLAEPDDFVGLVLDESAGKALGPELSGDVSYDNAVYWNNNSATVTVSGGQAIWASASSGNAVDSMSMPVFEDGVFYQIEIDVASLASGYFRVASTSNGALYSEDINTTGITTVIVKGDGARWKLRCVGTTTGAVNSASFKKLPGNTITVANNAARPVLKEENGVQFYRLDGNDDAFEVPISNFTDNMSCFFAIRTDDANFIPVAGDTAAKFFLVAQSGSSNSVLSQGAGSPSYLVNGAGLSGSTRGHVHTDLAEQGFVVVEAHGLQMAAWTRLIFGSYTGDAPWPLDGDFILPIFIDNPTVDESEKIRSYMYTKAGVSPS